MDTDRALDALVLDIYDAAYDAARWPAVLERISAYAGAQGTHFFLWDKPASTLLVSGLSGFQPEAEALYGSHYGALDPRRQFVDRQPIGTLFACHTKFDDAFVSKNEFYSDFLIPMGARYVLISRLAEDRDMTGIVGFLRTPRQAPFDEKASRRIEPLMPHLIRAAAFTRRFAELRRTEMRLDAALDRVGWGMMLVDAESRLVVANAAAEAILRSGDGLGVSHGRLTPAHGADAAKLSRMIRESATQTGQAKGGAMALVRPSGRRALQLQIGPLREPPAGMAEARAGLAVIVVTDPEREARLPAAQLQALFGLTAAEARVAAELAEGRSISEIAATHRTSRNTVRVQVQSILDKTGTARQAELVAMLSRLPRPFNSVDSLA